MSDFKTEKYLWLSETLSACMENRSSNWDFSWDWSSHFVQNSTCSKKFHSTEQEARGLISFQIIFFSLSLKLLILYLYYGPVGLTIPGG